MKEIVIDGVRFLAAPDGIRSPWELEQQRLTDWLRDHPFDRATRTTRHLVLFTGRKSVIFRCTWSDLFDSCASLGLALTVDGAKDKDWVVRLEPLPVPAPERPAAVDLAMAYKVLEYFPADPAQGRGLNEVVRLVAEQRAMTKMVFRRLFILLEGQGRIRKNSTGLWYQVPEAVAVPRIEIEEPEDF